MAWRYELFITPLLIATVLCVAVAIYAWSRRPAPGAVPLAVLLLAGAGYTLFVAMGMGSLSLPSCTLWWKAVFPPAVTVWPVWFVFAVEYSGRRHILTRSRLAALFLLPAATAALALTNDGHQLVGSRFTETMLESGPMCSWVAGPWFYVHAVYSDLCVLAGTILLVRWSLTLPRPYRTHVVLLVLAAAAPVVARAVSLLDGNPINYIDLSPFVLPVAGLTWAYGLERFGLYGVVPLARESVFRSSADGVVVLDCLGRVADANPVAEQLLGRAARSVRGRRLTELLPLWPPSVDLSRANEATLDVQANEPGDQRTLEVHLSPVFTRGHRFAGHVVGLRDVSEVRQAMEALDRANRLSDDILASISDGFFALDDNLTVTYFNTAAESLLGRSRADVVGRDIYEVFPQAPRLDPGARWEEAARTRTPISFELHLDEGPLRNWYEVRIYPSDRGAAVYFQVTTEQKAAAEALRASEEKFRGVVEQSRDGIVLVDEQGTIIEWNASQEAITGLSREQVVGRALWEVQAQVAADAAVLGGYEGVVERARAGFRNILDGRFPWLAHEARLRLPDGRIRHMESRVFPIGTSSGRLVCSISRDVTEQREADSQRAALHRVTQATSESDDLQQLFRLIHEAVAQLVPADNFHIALYDRDSGMVSFPYLVDSSCPAPEPRRDGRGRTEYILRTGRALLASEADLQRLVAEGEIEAEGTSAWSYLGVPLRGASGVIGVMAVQRQGHDAQYTESQRDLLMMVSGQVAMAIERKRAEEALRRNEAQLSSLMNLMAAGIMIVQDGRCLYANPAMETITGYRADELLERQYERIVHPDDRALIEMRRARRRTGAQEPTQYELRILRPDGETRWLAVVTSMTEFAGAPALLVSGLDITELKRLQEQVAANQRLSSLGTIAAGVAHELNSPLQVITGFAHTLVERLDAGTLAPAQLRRRLDLIERNAWRCAEIVGSLLTYARPSAPSMAPVDLNAVVRDALLLTGHQLGQTPGVTLGTRLEEDLPPVRCDYNQMVQVLINLLANARDAVADGGSIVVSTSASESRNVVLLQVEDNGIGMTESVQARIFDPFFTTKEPGKGTGLGLSIVSGIVRGCGGDITVESAPGQGSRFTLSFPVTQLQYQVSAVADEGGRYDDAGRAGEKAQRSPDAPPL